MTTEHQWHAPCACDGRGCMFCVGGLECCKICGAFEGATPDECPGKQMSYDFSELVYKGIINYRDGNWYGECCQAMRHIHDAVKFMAEKGYKPDGRNGWVKTNPPKMVVDYITR